MMKFKPLLILLLIVICLGTLSIVFRADVTQWYYLRFRGGELSLLYDERQARLEIIWSSLCQFEEQNGAFPQSIDEWIAFDQRVPELLRPPMLGIGDYVYKPESFATTEVAPVIIDPGTTWAGAGPRDIGRTEAMFPDLMNNGSIGKVVGSEVILWTRPAPCESLD